jgi:purine nucleosidase
MKLKRCAVLVLLLLNLSSLVSRAQTAAASPSKVILDTDIGDDVDDVFALGLALASPELKILGITSAWGDTALRSQMLDRLLCETGRDDIPVRTGVATKSNATFSQKNWADQGIKRSHGDAVSFLLEQIKLNPGEITLIAVAPLTNIGAAIDLYLSRIRRSRLRHYPRTERGVQHRHGRRIGAEAVPVRRSYFHDAARFHAVEVR